MKQLLAGGLLLATVTAVVPVWADVQACLAASEKGQRARAAGRLREARESFIVCGAETCPSLVRRDCAQWSSEIAPTIPTVVFGAHDKAGRDFFDVTVSMDGEVVVKKLDGKSIAVDPGKHTLRFDIAGLPSVTEVVLIKEGEHARAVNVTFDSGSSSTTPTNSVAGTATGAVQPGADTGKHEGHTPYPWILVGVGVVGVAVGAAILLTTPDRPSNCNADTLKCTRLDKQSDDDFRKDQERAGTADSQPVLGYIVAAGGLAFIGGGLLWHFLEPTGPTGGSRSSARIMPWTTGKASGISLGTSF